MPAPNLAQNLQNLGVDINSPEGQQFLAKANQWYAFRAGAGGAGASPQALNQQLATMAQKWNAMPAAQRTTFLQSEANQGPEGFMHRMGAGTTQPGGGGQQTPPGGAVPNRSFQEFIGSIGYQLGSGPNDAAIMPQLEAMYQQLTDPATGQVRPELGLGPGDLSRFFGNFARQWQSIPPEAQARAAANLQSRPGLFQQFFGNVSGGRGAGGYDPSNPAAPAPPEEDTPGASAPPGPPAPPVRPGPPNRPDMVVSRQQTMDEAAAARRKNQLIQQFTSGSLSKEDFQAQYEELTGKPLNGTVGGVQFGTGFRGFGNQGAAQRMRDRRNNPPATPTEPAPATPTTPTPSIPMPAPVDDENPTSDAQRQVKPPAPPITPGKPTISPNKGKPQVKPAGGLADDLQSKPTPQLGGGLPKPPAQPGGVLPKPQVKPPVPTTPPTTPDQEEEMKKKRQSLASPGMGRRSPIAVRPRRPGFMRPSSGGG